MTLLYELYPSEAKLSTEGVGTSWYWHLMSDIAIFSAAELTTELSGAY